jgi:hypothetical protein
MLASLLANIHRDRKRHPQPFRPEDFMPLTAKDRSGLDPVIVRSKLLIAFAGRIKHETVSDPGSEGTGSAAQGDGSQDRDQDR